MRTRLILALTCLSSPAQAITGVCVTNGAEEEYLFVAEAHGGPRQVAWLAPATELCSNGSRGSGGVVSVFVSEDHEEGCSRLVAEGETEVLLRYSDFDRCYWSSHDR